MPFAMKPKLEGKKQAHKRKLQQAAPRDARQVEVALKENREEADEVERNCGLEGGSDEKSG